MQATNQLLMIRPVDFKFNTQTAGNNKFQVKSVQADVQTKALAEFDGFVEILRHNGVHILVVDDTINPETPDSIFPNNWVSFHNDGSVFLYPMFSENRRQERRLDIIEQLKNRFEVNHIGDLSFFEQQGVYLEGTGSMVLDRDEKIAYACISVRTDINALSNFCMLSGYKPVYFDAADAAGFPIYHTNVMMCVGSRFAVICLQCIPDELDREMVKRSLNAGGKEVIEITLDQMNHFAGNMLEVKNDDGEALLVMSTQAYSVLGTEQIEKLEQYCRIIYAPLNTIEQNGGGSARCMLAEIHLPLREN